jgi:hypothetical protein
MARLKAGTRMRSAVCDTEIMVVAAPDGDVALECGGAPMRSLEAQRPEAGSPSPDHAAGSKIGKRYADEAGSLEVLCVKPGDGSLSLAGSPLKEKGAKPLPSSD